MTTLTAVYEEHTRLLSHLAKKYKRCYRTEYDEARSLANELFVVCTLDHDDTKGPIGKRLGWTIWRRMVTHGRKQYRIRKREVVLDDVSNHNRFDHEHLMKEVSQHAREVIDLVLTEPPDLLLHYHTGGVDDPLIFRRRARKALIRLLTEIGWTRRRIQRTFDELREALS